MKKHARIKFRPSSLDTTKSITKELFESFSEPEDAIANLIRFIYKKGPSLPYSEYDEVAENIWIHKSAQLSSNVKIDAPAIICANAKICHGAHIKASVIGSFASIGDNSQVIGSIIFDRAHLNYSNIVCSSIIGYGAKLSAGVSVCEEKQSIMPDSQKRSSVICDFAAIGANSVVAPGIIIDEYSTVPPLCIVSQDVKAFSVYKRK